MERTFVILKPDAMQRGIAGDVIGRLEKIGLKLVAAKMFVPSEEMLNKHYPVDRKEFIEGMGEKTLENYKDLGMNPKDFFEKTDAYSIGLIVQKWLVDFMISAPVLAMVWEGPHAVEIVRKVRGHTLPLKAQPGTITGDYSFDSSSVANNDLRPIRNLVHASGNVEEAEFEINLWFSDDEIFDYDTVHQTHMLPLTQKK